MTERSYGYLYDTDRPVKEDAALIRRTIKTMCAAGVLPADWKYSVRYRTFAGGRSIDITALSPRPIRLMDPGYVFASPDRDRVVRVPVEREMVSMRIYAGTHHEVRWIDVGTAEAGAVVEALQELLNACNHDGSDSQSDHFDVKFYGHPSIDTIGSVPRAVHALPSYWPARLGVR